MAVAIQGSSLSSRQVCSCFADRPGDLGAIAFQAQSFARLSFRTIFGLFSFAGLASFLAKSEK